jgi:hypothetical protein
MWADLFLRAGLSDCKPGFFGESIEEGKFKVPAKILLPPV